MTRHPDAWFADLTLITLLIVVAVAAFGFSTDRSPAAAR
jgi:hypothetical protein